MKTVARRIIREDIHSTEHRDAAHARAFKHKDLTRHARRTATQKRSSARKASAVDCSKSRRSVARISRVMREMMKIARVATTDREAIARVITITVMVLRVDICLAAGRKAIKTGSKEAIVHVTTTTETPREAIARATTTIRTTAKEPISRVNNKTDIRGISLRTATVRVTTAVEKAAIAHVITATAMAREVTHIVSKAVMAHVSKVVTAIVDKVATVATAMAIAKEVIASARPTMTRTLNIVLRRG